MAGHSAIDAEAEANYAKDGLGSGISFAIVALKVAKNLASGSQEMLDRLAAFEWSYKIKGDHLATPEGDRFSKLIATEKPLQRAILESVERDFVNDPSVRQKIVVSVDNPTENSPDAQRRSYIYIYTRVGDEIKAMSIESFADDKALRALLKHLGCNDAIRAVEDGKVLIEPTSIRQSRDTLTLERVCEATRLVSETVSRTERSQDLVNRLQWYVENRELALIQLERDTHRRFEQLLQSGESHFVETARAQASELSDAIVGGQALAQQLHREENKNQPVSHEYVRVTRPEGITVVGIDARSPHAVNLDRVSVLGWGNMARWAELLGLSIPNRQSGARADGPMAENKATLRGQPTVATLGSSVAKGSTVSNVATRKELGSPLVGRGPVKKEQMAISAAKAASTSGATPKLRVGALIASSGLLKPFLHRVSWARSPQRALEGAASTARRFIGRQSGSSKSGMEVKGSRARILKGAAPRTSPRDTVSRGLSRARTLVGQLLQRREQRLNRRELRSGSKGGDGRRGERSTAAIRRSASGVRATSRLVSVARDFVRGARSRLRQPQVSIGRKGGARRVAIIRRSLIRRAKSLVRGGQLSVRQRGFRSRGASAPPLARMRIARSVTRLRALVRESRRGNRGERILARLRSARERVGEGKLQARVAIFLGLFTKRRTPQGALRVHTQRRELQRDARGADIVSPRLLSARSGALLLKDVGRLLERPRSRDSAQSLLFIEWLLRQTRTSRALAWFLGRRFFVDDSPLVSRPDVEGHEEEIAAREIRSEIVQEEVDAPDAEGASEEDELQDPPSNEAATLMVAEPRWELSIFTARQFNSRPSDPESAACAAH